MSVQEAKNILWAHKLATQQAHILQRLTKLEESQTTIDPLQAHSHQPPCAHHTDINALTTFTQSQNQRITALESTISALKTSHVTKSDVEKIVLRIQELEETMRQVRPLIQVVEQLQAENKTFRESITQLVGGFKSVSNRQQELTGLLETLKLEVMKLITDSDAMSSQVLAIENKVEDLLSASEADKAVLNTVRQQMKALSTTAKTLENSVKSLSLRYHTLEGQVNKQERHREVSVAETSTTEGTSIQGGPQQTENTTTMIPQKRGIDLVDTAQMCHQQPVKTPRLQSMDPRFITPAVAPPAAPATPEKLKRWGSATDESTPVAYDRLEVVRQRGAPSLPRQAIPVRNRLRQELQALSATVHSRSAAPMVGASLITPQHAATVLPRESAEPRNQQRHARQEPPAGPSVGASSRPLSNAAAVVAQETTESRYRQHHNLRGIPTSVNTQQTKTFVKASSTLPSDTTTVLTQETANSRKPQHDEPREPLATITAQPNPVLGTMLAPRPSSGTKRANRMKARRPIGLI